MLTCPCALLPSSTGGACGAEDHRDQGQGGGCQARGQARCQARLQACQEGRQEEGRQEGEDGVGCGCGSIRKQCCAGLSIMSQCGWPHRNRGQHCNESGCSAAESDQRGFVPACCLLPTPCAPLPPPHRLTRAADRCCRPRRCRSPYSRRRCWRPHWRGAWRCFGGSRGAEAPPVGGCVSGQAWRPEASGGPSDHPPS